ncbi:PucR family transcriptional regulator [Nocardioides terrisoli]|uniref:PucR family transcriptional regulator n=1 Tax=Nocardioides terrisoli TaxID=3388267 RepID=UPI00287B910B|nr:helix-turn-helix domain-containing protein [Nocardioides marmorisolisilvae]
MATSARSRAQITQRLTRAAGSLSSAALARMEHDLPWVRQLPAEDRSWIGLIVQAGIKSFIDWYRSTLGNARVSAEVFGVAPRDLATEISFEQTVALVRLSISVVDEHLDDVLGDADAHEVRAVLNSYARELAFATAEVYARAAEQRGAWDARLEALVVDAVLRGSDNGDDDLVSRASALGWRGGGRVVVTVGGLGSESAIDSVRRFAHDHKLDCLCAVQGKRLVVVLGGVGPDGRPVARLADSFAPGPVVIGPVVPGLGDARRSAEAALSGLRAVPGWVDAPRPVAADDLLAERALDGDAEARAQLVEQVYAVLASAGAVILDTTRVYLDNGSSIEATARALFVHANTVRYRLRRATELTGLNPIDPRDAYTVRTALVLGRLQRGSDGGP